ncbi:c-type cytochrome [Rhizobium sp. SL42]|uniref:c-type cytochrome n=1 Tax=Rhizobium sp. SL42 TaxID=2806346 RepID=UPI001F00B0C0|nr:c-type cytochrome [Rhizobium sp. SL42]UJW77594.1 cytochrome c5 family protein [Rhizobium sp. SL42]
MPRKASNLGGRPVFPAAFFPAIIIEGPLLMKLWVLAIVLLTAITASAIAQDRAAEEVYRDYCSACHAPTNVMVSSPKAGVSKDWGPRLGKGLPALLKSAIEGFNAMPRKGTCEDCSAKELESAIRFMVGE